MNKSLYVQAIFAGIVFGIWPLVMNRSHLSGNISAGVFATTVAMCVLPFTLWELRTTGVPTSVNWWLGIVSGVLSGVGMLAFTSVLSQAPPTRVAAYFVIVLAVQAMAPVAYQVFVARAMTFQQAIGFALAVGGTVLLTLAKK